MASLADGYTEDWRRYKKARNTLWLVFLSYLPGVPLVAWGVSKVVRRESSELWVPVALVWMAALVLATLRVYRWRCPKCEKSFSGPYFGNKGFLARKCVHCGLPKYAAHR